MKMSNRYVGLVPFRWFLLLAIAVLSSGLVFTPAGRAQGADPEADISLLVWDASTRDKKISMITRIIADYKETKGVVIRKEPRFYVERIDKMRRDDPALSNEPIGTLLRTLVVMFRDFDNGADPEETARLEFGEEKYQQTFKNKKAFEEIYREYLREK
ncbi:MAG: hypothetical protein JW847_00925 [Candidatus Omnitrophica bacterium]|nr:hypothetical protein [Candidatus Omnitrophota bacterium]